jgi:hypothetical protein
LAGHWLERGDLFGEHSSQVSDKLLRHWKAALGPSSSAGYGLERSRTGAVLTAHVLFPLIDVIYFGVSYYSVLTLNDLQLREASKSAKSMAVSNTGEVIAGIPNKWASSAMGGLAKLTTPPVTNVDYKLSEVAVYVTVTTNVSIEPLLKIPFLTKIPALGAPVEMKVARTKVLENPNDMFR